MREPLSNKKYTPILKTRCILQKYNQKIQKFLNRGWSSLGHIMKEYPKSSNYDVMNKQRNSCELEGMLLNRHTLRVWAPTSLLMRVVSRTPVYRSWTRTLSGWKKSGLFSSLGRIHLQWWERREQLSNVFKYLCHRLMRHLLLHCDTYVLLSCVWVLIQHRGWTQHNLT